MTQPVEHHLRVGDLDMAYFEWGEPDGAPLLMAHANGFHARCWDQVIARMSRHHIIAVDMRGHGRTAKQGPYSWPVLADDLQGLIEALDLRNLVGVGHSMGGHAVAQTASHVQDRFSRLVLIDPVILAPDVYRTPDAMAAMFPNGHPVARRRNRFEDSAAMFRNFEGRGSYATWTREALRDYCDWGLERTAEGDFRLACPPEVEAAMYMANFQSDIHERLATIELPVTVLRARQRKEPRTDVMDFSGSPTWPELASLFTRGRDVYLPDLTHFLPMQAPGLVAAWIEERATEAG